MRLTILCALVGTETLAASDAYPPPRFTDPGRVEKVQSAMPEIDRIFRGLRHRQKDPRDDLGRFTGALYTFACHGSPRSRRSVPWSIAFIDLDLTK